MNLYLRIYEFFYEYFLMIFSMNFSLNYSSTDEKHEKELKMTTMKWFCLAYVYAWYCFPFDEFRF